MVKEQLKDEMIRVDKRFNAEIKEIKNDVREKCKKKFSDRKITNLVVRHEDWKGIKVDIKNKLAEDAKAKRGRRKNE